MKSYRNDFFYNINVKSIKMRIKDFIKKDIKSFRIMKVIEMKSIMSYKIIKVIEMIFLKILIYKSIMSLK